MTPTLAAYGPAVPSLDADDAVADALAETIEALDVLLLECARGGGLAAQNPAAAGALRRLAGQLRERITVLQITRLPDPPAAPAQRVQFVRAAIWRDENLGQVALAADGRLFRRAATGAAWELVQEDCTLAQAEAYVASLPGHWHRGGGVCPPPGRGLAATG